MRIWNGATCGTLPAAVRPRTHWLVNSMNAREQHKIKARPFAISCGSDAYPTGWSAVGNHGLWTLGRPPDLPLVVRPKASGRGPSVTAHGRIPVAQVPPGIRAG